MSDRALELACAGLTLLESLILELKEKGLISSDELAGLFEDARDAHRHASTPGSEDFHANVASIIDLLLEGGDATNICDRMARREISGG